MEKGIKARRLLFLRTVQGTRNGEKNQGMERIQRRNTVAEEGKKEDKNR